jgi:Domain of unknown function (DUF4124)
MIARICLWAFLSLAAVSHADVYKYFDDDGNMVLSDTLPKDPALAAKAVRLETRQIMTIPAVEGVPAPQTKTTEKKSEASAANYLIVIQSPKADETYFAAEGAVALAYSVTPALQDGHRIEALVDGAIVPEGGAIDVPSLERGEHAFRVRVVDAENKQIAEASVAFFVQQPKVPKPVPKPQPKPKK